MRRLSPVIGAVIVAVSWAPAQASTSQETLAGLANRERSGSGVSALALEPALSELASRHAAEMALSGRLYHNATLAQQITGWQVIGENVGRGARLEQIHAAFMASSPHRAQILGSRYNAIGVGIAVGASGVLWVDEIFVSRIGTAPAPAAVAPIRRFAPVRTPDASPVAETAASPPEPEPAPPPESAAPPPPAVSVQAHRIAREVMPPGESAPAPPLIASGLALLCLALGGQILRLARRGDGAQ
ncbi:MAG: CAP domain-containing protein [Actinomycetota bacterium]